MNLSKIITYKITYYQLRIIVLINLKPENIFITRTLYLCLLLYLILLFSNRDLKNGQKVTVERARAVGIMLLGRMHFNLQFISALTLFLIFSWLT